MMIGIVAVSKNFAIGKGGKLPWHYPEDLKFFKRTTMGSAVVMGSVTWKAIGGALPGRLNLVLGRNPEIVRDTTAIPLSSTSQLTELSKYLCCDTYVIGGARVYESLGSLIDEWLVTDIPIDVSDADTFMPGDFLDGFSEVERLELPGGMTVRRLHRNT